MLANIHILALVDVGWISGVRLARGMRPLLRVSVLDVSFNDLEVERGEFLSCARVQLSASVYHRMSLSLFLVPSVLNTLLLEVLPLIRLLGS